MASQLQSSRSVAGGKRIATYYGKSTDEKPVSLVTRGSSHPLATGSIYYELDTKAVFMFDADATPNAGAWVRQ